jgi:ribosomal protein S18 acetylase RimI-like enzyme
MKPKTTRTQSPPKAGKASIREATAEDAAAILDCLAVAFAPFREQYTAEGYRDTTLTPETIRQRLQTMTIFLAVAPSGEIIGTIGGATSGNEGHIRGMAVRPEWQGRGVADQLLEAVENGLQAKGCSHITLDTTQPLQRAIRFYERHGYKASGRISDFFGMPLFEYVKPLKS